MSDTFEISIANLPELTKLLASFPSISEPIYQKAIEGAQFILQKNTLKDDPVPWRTGNLLQSFRYRTSRLMAEWFPTANYAPFVEFGTQPHEIHPRNPGGVLAWQSGASTGRYVTSASGRSRYQSGSKGTTSFARFVRHPGTRARPFMARIVEKSQGAVTDLFTQATDMVLQKIAQSAS